MPHEKIWLCVEVLASGLDGSRSASEQVLDELFDEVTALPPPERDEIRKRLILIVAQLSRLEMRLVDADGHPPFPAAV